MATSQPPCADRCALVADLVVQLARATGRTERAERVALGLSPDYVPPTPPRVTASSAGRWLTEDYAD